MFTFHKSADNKVIAELTDRSLTINSVEDAIDLLGEAGVAGCDRIIINESSLNSDFFNLRTRLAGDILQKFSNYRVCLAIVGDFSKYDSRSLRDFIRECNRGRQVFFVDTLESAIGRLAGTRVS